MNPLSDIRQKIKDGSVQLVDVREPHEWEDAHFEDAILIPLSHLQDGSEIPDLDRDRPLYLHCRSGRRVFSAAPVLEQMGYRQVIPLQESFQELARAGLKVTSASRLHIQLTRSSGYIYNANNSHGQSVRLDGPAHLGGMMEGFRPMEMVLVGLAGCSAVDIEHILEKGRHSLQTLTVEVTGQRANNVPAVFTDIHVVFSASGSFDQKTLERAVTLSMETYCSVAKMLDGQVRITHQANLIAPSG
jgi:putative redox protein